MQTCDITIEEITQASRGLKWMFNDCVLNRKFPTWGLTRNYLIEALQDSISASSHALYENGISFDKNEVYRKAVDSVGGFSRLEILFLMNETV